MTAEQGIFLSKLENLCLQYDKAYGTYPEHEYEGQFFYKFVLEEMLREENYLDVEEIWENNDLKGYNWEDAGS